MDDMDDLVSALTGLVEKEPIYPTVEPTTKEGVLWRCMYCTKTSSTQALFSHGDECAWATLHDAMVDLGYNLLNVGIVEAGN